MHSTKRDFDTFIQKFENCRILSIIFKRELGPHGAEVRLDVYECAEVRL